LIDEKPLFFEPENREATRSTSNNLTAKSPLRSRPKSIAREIIVAGVVGAIAGRVGLKSKKVFTGIQKY
jgi:hypothetical protein